MRWQPEPKSSGGCPALKGKEQQSDIITWLDARLTARLARVGGLVAWSSLPRSAWRIAERYSVQTALHCPPYPRPLLGRQNGAKAATAASLL